MSEWKGELMLLLRSMPDNPSNIESLNRAISSYFLDDLKPLFEFLAFASMPGSAEAFRQALEDWQLYFQEQDKTLLAFIIKHGLIGVDKGHFTDEQLWLLVRWTVEYGNDTVNRLIPSSSRKSKFRPSSRVGEAFPTSSLGRRFALMR